MSYSVIFQDVTKSYRMKKGIGGKLKSLISPTSRHSGETHEALKNVSLKVPKGDVVGILGINGSGKSTFSHLLIGATSPTTGKIEVEGVVSLIAISSGLNGQLTGRENIELKGLMLGFSPKEIREIEEHVIQFADLGKFIDQPVKTYSSGMKSRLGFAISVHVNPDILVVDEALSVGDQTFYEKCLSKFDEFKAQGKTIFFVSHSMSQIRRFCESAIWLHQGELKAYGPVRDVIRDYQQFLNAQALSEPSKEEVLG